MKQVTGCGVDIEEIGRVERLCRETKFLTRCFTAQERAYFFEKGMHPCHVAGMFCAKEAFYKAVGRGTFREIEIIHDEKGKPSIHLLGQLARWGEGKKFLLSISHSREYAVAQVLLLEEV